MASWKGIEIGPLIVRYVDALSIEELIPIESHDDSPRVGCVTKDLTR